MLDLLCLARRALRVESISEGAAMAVKLENANCLILVHISWNW